MGGIGSSGACSRFTPFFILISPLQPFGVISSFYFSLLLFSCSLHPSRALNDIDLKLYVYAPRLTPPFPPSPTQPTPHTNATRETMKTMTLYAALGAAALGLLSFSSAQQHIGNRNGRHFKTSRFCRGPNCKSVSDRLSSMTGPQVQSTCQAFYEGRSWGPGCAVCHPSCFDGDKTLLSNPGPFGTGLLCVREGSCEPCCQPPPTSAGCVLPPGGC